MQGAAKQALEAKHALAQAGERAWLRAAMQAPEPPAQQPQPRAVAAAPPPPALGSAQVRSWAACQAHALLCADAA